MEQVVFARSHSDCDKVPGLPCGPCADKPAFRGALVWHAKRVAAARPSRRARVDLRAL